MTYPITFGKYLLLERINVGGMAEVFRAKAFGVEGFERILAIKRILPNMAEDDEFINMFVDEARIAVQLSHANVVQIFELGKFQNQYYIAMEYVSGKDVRQVFEHFREQERLLPVPATAFLASKICEGLDYAHHKLDASGRPLNLVHRDVSPQNILVSYEGAVKITDFGIAKAEDRASKTQAGVLKGKFGYMSPEQVRGQLVDARSDVFAVGIFLYELVTGKRLFLGESDFATLERVRNAEIPSLRAQNPEVSEEMEAVVMKALARDRDERYQTASELHDALQRFLIEDNSIYNAKRLSELLATEFKSEIQGERNKMEEFSRVSAPYSAEAVAGADDMQRALRYAREPDKPEEQTMIFESEFAQLTTGETQITQTGYADAPSDGDSVPEALRTQSSVAAPQSPVQPGADAATVVNRSPPSHGGLIVIAAAALVSLIVVFVVLLRGATDHGTLIIESTPSKNVRVYLDDTLIATRTPVTRNDIAVGSHLLRVEATGFAQKIYRFELEAGAPAAINVVLEPAVPVSRASGVVIVQTSPSGARIEMDGEVVEGTTPLELRGLAPGEPTSLRLSLNGHTTKEVEIALSAAGARDIHQFSLDRAPEPTPSAGRGMGTLRVLSRPPAARVFLEGVQKGVTPLEISSLDVTRAYVLELEKNGFRTFRRRVDFDGREQSIEIDAPLVAEEKRPSGGRGGRPGGAGAGRCGGKGAKLSVMLVGQADCMVKVGGEQLGFAPLFKKDSPTGRCAVEVSCPGGKFYKKTIGLRSGSHEKLIIKETDWKK